MPVPAHIPVGKSAVLGKPVVSPDGRLLAAACDDLVALYDLHTRELVGTVPIRTAFPIRFEADGRSVGYLDAARLLQTLRGKVR